MNRKYERNKILRSIPADMDDLASENDLPIGCHFSQETINGLIGLGEILRKIHIRLIREGYSIIDGKLISPIGETFYERKSPPKT